MPNHHYPQLIDNLGVRLIWVPALPEPTLGIPEHKLLLLDSLLMHDLSGPALDWALDQYFF